MMTVVHPDCESFFKIALVAGRQPLPQAVLQLTGFGKGVLWIGFTEPASSQVKGVRRPACTSRENSPVPDVVPPQFCGPARDM